MPKKTSNKENSGKKAYLEIYIEESGKILLTPINKANKPIINELKHSRKSLPEQYCG